MVNISRNTSIWSNLRRAFAIAAIAAMPCAAEDFTHLPASQQAPISSPQTHVTALQDAKDWKKDWKFVKIGAAVNLVGYGLDAGTSLHQPEGNNLLSDSKGRFGAKALGLKSLVQFSEIAVGCLVAHKFPKYRKIVGGLLLVTGGVTLAQGVRNLKENPAFFGPKP